MKTPVIGYSRVGTSRELKFAAGKYFKQAIAAEDLSAAAAGLRKVHWQKQFENAIGYISNNDFSFYDTMLDTAVLLNAVPERYRVLGLSPLDEHFAMARGYQGKNGDAKAFAMKKWFNTSYHYLVPEIGGNTEIKLAGTKPFDEYTEVKKTGVETRPAIIGAFTFLKLMRCTGTKKPEGYLDSITGAYGKILNRFNSLGAAWVQFGEPYLVTDLSAEDRALFLSLYRRISSAKSQIKVLLQIYFDDIRDCYGDAASLAFDGIGLDLIEGKKSLELVGTNGFPKDKILFTGIVNGRNTWKNNYTQTYKITGKLQEHCGEIMLSTSCSLLYVPYTLRNETKLSEGHRSYFAFAEEKLAELRGLKAILSDKAPETHAGYLESKSLFARDGTTINPTAQNKVHALSEQDFIREPSFYEREKI